MDLLYRILFFAVLVAYVAGQEDICTVASHVQSSGNISSPNYPSDYGNNVNCTTKILAPTDKVITVRFLNFSIEKDRTCRFDNLTIYVGSKLYGGRVYCGTQQPRDFVSRHQEVTFTFVSDESDGKSGFLIQWAITDACASGQYQCANGDCIPSSQRCDRAAQCADQSDEIECAIPSTSFSECGAPDTAPQFLWNPRIVGGSEATAGSWPWQVLVSSRDKSCGGSIIAAQWVATAAHCTDGLGDTSFTVYAGSNTLQKVVQSKKSKRKIDHPSYTNTGNYRNDISLIELESPFDLTNAVRPICLPSNTATFDLPAGTVCVATGWGFLGSGLEGPQTMYQVRLPIVDKTTCLKHFSPLYDTNVCAGGSAKGGLDTCQGDSGGPLVCLVNSQRWYLIGITSFGGDKCATPGEPGVYTRTSKYEEWIKSYASIPDIPTTLSSSTTTAANAASTTTSTKTATTTATPTAAPPPATTKITTTTTTTATTTEVVAAAGPTTLSTSTSAFQPTPTTTTDTISPTTSTTSSFLLFGNNIVRDGIRWVTSGSSTIARSENTLFILLSTATLYSVC